MYAFLYTLAHEPNCVCAYFSIVHCLTFLKYVHDLGHLFLKYIYLYISPFPKIESVSHLPTPCGQLSTVHVLEPCSTLASWPAVQVKPTSWPAAQVKPTPWSQAKRPPACMTTILVERYTAQL